MESEKGNSEDEEKLYYKYDFVKTLCEKLSVFFANMKYNGMVDVMAIPWVVAGHGIYIT